MAGMTAAEAAARLRMIVAKHLAASGNTDLLPILGLTPTGPRRCAAPSCNAPLGTTRLRTRYCSLSCAGRDRQAAVAA